MATRPKSSFGLLTPARLLALGFAGAIAFGTVLLALPIASSNGRSVGIVNALFTATSAVCVTGLTVVDTATAYSRFGQVVILILIQAGGLGIMTMSTALAIMLGKRITLRERLVIREAMGEFDLSGLVRLTRYVLLMTIAFESVGAAILAIRWAFDFPVLTAMYRGLFHAVSAFNNAGFDLFTVSFQGYVEDPIVVLTVSWLIVSGGIGFSVVTDVTARAFNPHHRLTVHTKTALFTTAILIGGGMALILAFEHHNRLTLGDLTWNGKLLAALFHSITPRTAGFSTIPVDHFYPVTLLLTIVLMFVGASPGGTGGGIKTTTAATILKSVVATVRGQTEVEIFERRLPRDIVDRSVAVTIIALFFVLTMTAGILITEGTGLLAALFEVTSAFGTVGLSTGITPSLSTAGKLIIALTMYTGRVGPVTLAVAIAQRQRRRAEIHLPEEKIMVG